MNAGTSFEQAQKIHYAEVRKRLYDRPAKTEVAPQPVEVKVWNPRLQGPKRKPKKLILPTTIIPANRNLRKKKIWAAPEEPPRVLTLWEQYPTYFNAHVIAHHRYMLMKVMEETGEKIDAVLEERKQIIDIVMEVLEKFPGVSVADLRGRHKRLKLALPRQLAMYEVYNQRVDLSFPVIGRWFGGRDHTTVLHAVKKITAMRSNELSGEAR